MNDLQNKVDFSFIRYANCWEDADVLIDALTPDPSQSILCIASAGDNALALLGAGAGSVHAIDISEPQLYLTELKQQSFLHLEYAELLHFLGVRESTKEKRLYHYAKVRNGLSASARAFWDNNKRLIENGVTGAGKFENYFSFFRKWFLPLAHTRSTVSQLLEPKTDAEQRQFYNKRWNTWRWQLLVRFFFGKFVLGRYGRDPEFLKHVEIPVAQYIKSKTSDHLASSLATHNYFLSYILQGRFLHALPYYLREENFLAIKNNAINLTISNQSADEALSQRSYQAHCFSNIFEYMSTKEFSNLVANWSLMLPLGSKLAYWNLMLPRRFSTIDPESFVFCKKAGALSATDKGFFYRGFMLDEKI